MRNKQKTDKYTLYGAEFSLYSGKARAYLDYKNIPYDEILSTLKIYKKIIIPHTGVRFIPVVKTPSGDYLQDTSHIIDTLENEFPQQSVYPDTPKQKLVSLLLELYGDEWLLIPAMHYRWNHDNFPFIYQQFGNIINPKFPAFLRAFIGKKIGNRFKDIVPGLGITDKTIPAIENWYENRFLAEFDQHLQRYPYLLGSVPSIADFGFIGPLYAHLYRDPYPGSLMKTIAPHVANWVERMRKGHHEPGNFIEGDSIPETLKGILNDQFQHQWPVLEETGQRLSLWYEQQNDKSQPLEIPRRLGTHDFNLGGVNEQRLVLPYSLWKMQRPLDYYQSLNSDEKAEVDPFLKSLGIYKAMQFKLKYPIVRINNRFMLAPT
ncbi:MAG TPA: glutathione S-transferase family protein [Aeromonadales bacterium]|nr:glutathione S-transferase family protein [Aeromonadales bacterium]